MADAKGQGNAPRKSGDKEQLTRDAWLDAAADVIAEGGFDNVRVLVLAKKLGVTRGSFYWHFRDHQDLIVSFLQRWRDRRLGELSYWKLSEDDIPGELRRKMHVLLRETTSNVWRMRIELAVREFARRDEHAASIVAEVDQARLAQNAALMEQLSMDPDDTRDLALLLYVVTVGSQLVLAGPMGDEPTISRIEQLITELVERWGGPID